MKKGIIPIIFVGIGVVASLGLILSGKKVEDTRVDKFKSYYNMLNQWLLLKQEGKSLVKYFEDKGYKSIAIYGMGEIGNRLYDELKKSNIEVKYAIDKNATNTYSDIKVCELEDDLAPVDVIIVTAIFAFDEIEKKLTEVVNYPIISLEDIIYEI